MAEFHLWIKAAHIVSLIAWMAAMLYLPRLMVYHCAAAAGSETAETFKVMERRLLKAIMTPAMLATWVFGLALAFTPGIVDWSSSGWFHAKLALVLAMTGVHGLLARHVKTFAADANAREARYFRILNEVPTVLLVAIVLLAVVKPF